MGVVWQKIFDYMQRAMNILSPEEIASLCNSERDALSILILI